MTKFDRELNTSPITGEVEGGAWSDDALAQSFTEAMG